jgi:hypothetical protein
MKLHEADCHLEFARLFLAMDEPERARESMYRASQLIEIAGYHRRDKDLREIAEQLSENREETLPRSTPVRDRVFIVYSHADTRWFDKLRKFLIPILGDYQISLWDDRAIRPGTKWREELSSELESAKVVLLLVSPDFLASDFGSQELPTLLGTAEKDKLKVLWVPLRPSTYRETPLFKYQAVNDPSKPLSKLPAKKRDTELLRIAEAVQAVLLR